MGAQEGLSDKLDGASRATIDQKVLFGAGRIKVKGATAVQGQHAQARDVVLAPSVPAPKQNREDKRSDFERAQRRSEQPASYYGEQRAIVERAGE